MVPDAAGQTVSLAERWVAYVLLVAIVASSLGALAWTLRYREPYPALLLPRFNTIPEQASTGTYLDLDLTVEFADGSIEPLTEQDLFAQLPLVPRLITQVSFYQGLDEQGELIRPKRPWRHVVARGWDDGIAPGSDVARARDPRTVAWLRERMAVLFPDREPARLRFVWTRVTARLPGGEVLERRHAKTVEVPL